MLTSLCNRLQFGSAPVPPRSAVGAGNAAALEIRIDIEHVDLAVVVQVGEAGQLSVISATKVGLALRRAENTAVSGASGAQAITCTGE